jgi:hypothetical protein
MEVIFLNVVKYRLQFSLDVKTLFHNIAPSVSLQIWQTKQNHKGLSPVRREDGDDNHVAVSHKLWFSRTYRRACCHDEEAMWWMFKFSVKISWQTPWLIWTVSASSWIVRWVFVQEFSNFFNTFCHFVGTWSPWALIIFNWHSADLKRDAIEIPLSSLKNALQRPHEAFQGFW